MIEGTTKEVSEQYLVNGVELDAQEWYTFIRVLERCGVAAVIGQQKHKGAGRQSKVFQLPEVAQLSFKKK